MNTTRHPNTGASFVRRARSVFVTTYRRAVFTDAMLSFCEHTMRGAYDQLDVELVEFNAEAEHLYLLVAYPALLLHHRRLRSTKRFALGMLALTQVARTHARGTDSWTTFSTLRCQSGFDAFCTGDNWDTSLMLRTFADHPRLRWLKHMQHASLS